MHADLVLHNEWGHLQQDAIPENTKCILLLPLNDYNDQVPRWMWSMSYSFICYSTIHFTQEIQIWRSTMWSPRSSIYVYTPRPPFQSTPAPSPPAEGREQECSEKVSLGMYTYILPSENIWRPWNDLNFIFQKIIMYCCYKSCYKMIIYS